jgi:hypothetical protein
MMPCMGLWEDYNDIYEINNIKFANLNFFLLKK